MSGRSLVFFGENWDNIGLLVGSGMVEEEGDKAITGIFICNDLTPPVLQEALNTPNVNMIIAYHPPIFKGMKSIGFGSWKERLIAKCLAKDISVYSPHTTLDSLLNGMTDNVVKACAGVKGSGGTGLAKTIGPPPIQLYEIEIQDDVNVNNTMLEGRRMTGSFFVEGTFPTMKSLFQMMMNNNSNPNLKLEEIIMNFKFGETSPLFESTVGDANGMEQVVTMMFYSTSAKTLEGLRTFISSNFDASLGTVSPVFNDFIPPLGPGRLVEFQCPIKFTDLVDAIKKRLGLEYVQVAFAGKPEVKTVAICVGSGASLLRGVKADVFITGEMSHHDILDAVWEGRTSLIFCNHCSSERHFLPKLASIVKLLTGIESVVVSKEDKSPLALA